MWEFIVLGEIPGTSLKLSFEAWLIAMAALLVCAAAIWFTAAHRFIVLIAVAAALYVRRGGRWVAERYQTFRTAAPSPAAGK